MTFKESINVKEPEVAPEKAREGSPNDNTNLLLLLRNFGPIGQKTYNSVDAKKNLLV